MSEISRIINIMCPERNIEKMRSDDGTAKELQTMDSETVSVLGT